MIIKIRSNNPNFSDIIQKNPFANEGLYFMPLKNGHAVGAFVEGGYDILFQDSKHSYSNGNESNMLDIQSSCNPKIALDTFSDFFRLAFKSASEYHTHKNDWNDQTIGEMDIESYCSVEHMVVIDSNWANSNNTFVLSKYFPEIKLEHQVGKVSHNVVGYMAK